jgi:Malectin domain
MQRRKTGLLLLPLTSLIVLNPAANAQSLTLSSAATTLSGSASLNLTLSTAGSASAAALQWTLQYPAGSLSNVTVTAGTAAMSAGKIISCAPASGSYTCTLYGQNSNPVATGVVAVVNLTAATSGSIPIDLRNALGASATGSPLALSATGGTLSATSGGSTSGGSTSGGSTSGGSTSGGSTSGGSTSGGSTSGDSPTEGAPPAPTSMKTLSCAPLTLTSGSSGTCTLTLSSAAASAVSVELTSSNADVLTVPSSVTVPAGSSSAQFAVKAAGTTMQNVMVTAKLNGASVVATVSVTPSNVSGLRINVGGESYTDSSGQVWTADSGFSGGSSFSTTEQVRQTTRPALYQSGRSGPAFSYSLNVPNGVYTVVLKFSEPSATAAGQRAFNVDVNGASALSSFDIFAEAGGRNVAVDRSLPVTVSGGSITIRFAVGLSGEPLLNGIEVLSGTTAASTEVPGAIRVNAGGSSLTDISGLAWRADSGFTGGTVITTTTPIAKTATPAIYQSARTGVFTYTFAVPNGGYSVVLKFAEIAETPSRRQFHVALNGSRVLTNLNIVEAAGGAATAIDRSFPVAVSNGSLTIGLTTGENGFPLLNGIEIIPTLP